MFKERFPRVHLDSIRGSVRGTLSRERLADAGERVRGAIQKAATYQPSERAQQIKEDVIGVGRTVRSEIQEVGDYYTGSGGGGRRSRRERLQRYRLPETESDPADYYEQQNIANYAAAFSPPGLRFDWQGRQTGRRFESDVAYESMSHRAEPVHDDVVFENEYADYIAHFDPYASRSSGKRRKRSGDLIGRWFY